MLELFFLGDTASLGPGVLLRWKRAEAHPRIRWPKRRWVSGQTDTQCFPAVRSGEGSDFRGVPDAPLPLIALLHLPHSHSEVTPVRSHVGWGRSSEPRHPGRRHVLRAGWWLSRVMPPMW